MIGLLIGMVLGWLIYEVICSLVPRNEPYVKVWWYDRDDKITGYYHWYYETDIEDY